MVFGPPNGALVSLDAEEVVRFRHFPSGGVEGFALGTAHGRAGSPIVRDSQRHAHRQASPRHLDRRLGLLGQR